MSSTAHISARMSATAVVIQARSKMARGIRGFLKKLLDMPLDIVYEILGSLDTLDILNLARTRDLRPLLMSFSSAFLWKKARERAGMPPCPDHLSEPRFAALFFDKFCDFCHLKKPVRVVWSAYIKSCTKCLKEQFEEIQEGWEAGRGYPTSLAYKVPSICIPPSSDKHVWCSRAFDESWKSQYQEKEGAASKLKWLRDTIGERREVDLHATLCQEWMSEYRDRCLADKKGHLNDQKASFIAQYKAKWAEEFASPDCKIDLESKWQVSDAFNTAPTGKALKELEEELDKLMMEKRDERLEKELIAALQSRLPVLRELYAACIKSLPNDIVYPQFIEFARIPGIRNVYLHDLHGKGTFTMDTMEHIRANFSNIISQWQTRIETTLIDSLKQSVQFKDVLLEPAAFLELATTFFSCNKCPSGAPPLRYPQILMHPHATRAAPPSKSDESYKFTWGKTSQGTQRDPTTRVIRDTSFEASWNDQSVVIFDQDIHAVLASAIKLCGLDPKTTTAEQLEKSNPIFECKACNSVMGRTTMTWSGVTLHWREKHRSDVSIVLTLLDETEAATVRQRIHEKQEQERWYGTSKDLICVHCKMHGNMRELKQHVGTAHAKSFSHKDDVTLAIDALRIAPLYHLWPPREDWN